MATQSGVRVVYNLLPELAAGMAAKAAQAVADAAHRIEDEARGTVPVLTGELRDSIHALQDSPLHWTVEAGTDHATYVEYGTARHGAAQPYLVPAAHNEEPEFIAEMGRIVG